MIRRCHRTYDLPTFLKSVLTSHSEYVCYIDILQRTLDYLFHDLLPRGGFSRTFDFIRDRSRAVRNDFTMQHSHGSEAIECHDRCTRFHILALHFERDRTTFSIPLEEQQLMNSSSQPSCCTDLRVDDTFSSPKPQRILRRTARPLRISNRTGDARLPSAHSYTRPKGTS